MLPKCRRLSAPAKRRAAKRARLRCRSECAPAKRAPAECAAARRLREAALAEATAAERAAECRSGRLAERRLTLPERGHCRVSASERMSNGPRTFPKPNADILVPAGQSGESEVSTRLWGLCRLRRCARLLSRRCRAKPDSRVDHLPEFSELARDAKNELRRVLELDRHLAHHCQSRPAVYRQSAKPLRSV